MIIPNEEAVLKWVLALEGGMLMIGVGLFFGHALWNEFSRRKRHRLLERGRTILASALAEPPRLAESDRRWLQNLSLRLQIRLFTETARSVSGANHQRLAELARDVGLIDRAETRCRSPLWWRRLLGVRLLSALGGGEAAAEPLLRDPHPIVRAQAIEWAAGHPAPAVIAALIERLDDPHGLCRFKAQDSLLRMNEPVIEPLARHLFSPGRPAVESALRVAVGLADHRFLAPVMTLCRDPSARVRALAAGLLGKLGGDQSVDILKTLLADDDPGVRAAAGQALGQLRHWPAASALAALLRDPAWTVRREVGLALRNFGSPGILFLRRALKDPDRFAADMAQQVLDLPETYQRTVARS